MFKAGLHPLKIPLIARQMRDNVDATDLLALDIYDPAFKKRQELRPHTNVETVCSDVAMAAFVDTYAVQSVHL